MAQVAYSPLSWDRPLMVTMISISREIQLLLWQDFPWIPKPLQELNTYSASVVNEEACVIYFSGGFNLISRWRQVSFRERRMNVQYKLCGAFLKRSWKCTISTNHNITVRSQWRKCPSFTLSLPSSKSTFSQPSQREMYKWGSENW